MYKKIIFCLVFLIGGTSSSFAQTPTCEQIKNLSGCPGYESPSLEAQSIVELVIRKEISENVRVKLLIDKSFQAELNWRLSPVPGLNYGIYSTVVNSPQGIKYKMPFRVFVHDDGMNSLVTISGFVDGNGNSVDYKTVKVEPYAKLSDMKISPPQSSIISKGSVDVVVFSDPDCPVCKAMRPELERFIAKHRELNVSLIFTPIVSIHPNSRAKSLAILSVVAKQRLRAEKILESVGSGDVSVLRKTLSDQGLVVRKNLVASAKQRLIEGIKFASSLGFGNRTPIMVFPDTKNVIIGNANLSKMESKLK